MSSGEASRVRPLASAPFESLIELRPVVAYDDAFLLRVYASTRADELAQVPWSDEQKREFVEMQYRAQTADYQERFPGTDHSIIVVDGVPVGRIWVGRWDDEIRLLDITILPDRRDRGTGGVLLAELIDEARTAGKPLRHSVFKSNEAALRFYRRLGFEVLEDFEIYVLMEWTDAPDSDVRPPG